MTPRPAADGAPRAGSSGQPEGPARAADEHLRERWLTPAVRRFTRPVLGLLGAVFAGRRVEVGIGQREIAAIALDSGELCARHRRSFAKHRTFTDPAHQAELERLRGIRRREPEVERWPSPGMTR